MIEVLFNESEAGSMKIAKATRAMIAGDGPTAVFMAGKKQPPLKEGTGWIDGSPNEVICLGFMLDIGDIKRPVCSTYRKELIYSIYAQNQWEEEDDFEEELKTLGNVYEKELNRLKEFLEEGESIRIWYSDAPYSRCGFYSLCQILQKYKNNVSAVKLPEYVLKGQQITVYQSWNEVCAEEFAGFLPDEKKLSKEEIRMRAQNWTDLQEENTPLRAVINGKVLSVPEDFYDFLIWQELKNKKLKEARLIGNILLNTQIAISDSWYARRIEQHIRDGKIKIVKDAKNKYERILSYIS